MLRTLGKRTASTQLGGFQSCEAYLNACKRSRISFDSSQFRGTLYELSALKVLLMHFNCHSMQRVGGPGDNGVDLLGKWDLSKYAINDSSPALAKSLLLIAKTGKSTSGVDLVSDIVALVQCKNYKTKIKASTIRELAGIWEFHVPGESSVDRSRTFVFLVSPYPLTQQAQAQMDTSRVPMIHIRLMPLTRQEVGGAGDGYDLNSWKEGELGPVYINHTARTYLKGLLVEKELRLIGREKSIQGENSCHDRI